MIRENGEWNLGSLLNTELPHEFKIELQKLLRIRRSQFFDEHTVDMQYYKNWGRRLRELEIDIV